MKVIALNVKEASVSVNQNVIASIQKGLLLLVGFSNEDDESVLLPMAKKIFSSRVFPDTNGKTNWNVSTYQGEILSVSQFTLYASMKEGNRPSFVHAMGYEKAKALYQKWLEVLREVSGLEIPTGEFGADMEIHLIHDGPFTITYDSKELGL